MAEGAGKLRFISASTVSAAESKLNNSSRNLAYRVIAFELACRATGNQASLTGGVAYVARSCYYSINVCGGRVDRLMALQPSESASMATSSAWHWRRVYKIKQYWCGNFMWQISGVRHHRISGEKNNENIKTALARINRRAV